MLHAHRRRRRGAALSADAVAVLVGDRALVEDEVRLVGVVEAGSYAVPLDLLGRLRRRWPPAGALRQDVDARVRRGRAAGRLEEVEPRLAAIRGN